MLVLSRKPSQSILIGPDIRIEIVRIRPYQVRIGIEAPGHLNIVREELLLDEPQPRPNGPAPRPASGRLPAGRR